MNGIVKHYLSISVTKLDKISGWLLYPISDLIAQLIIGDVSLLRIFIVAVVGRYVYAIETPKWFGFLATWARLNTPQGLSRFFWSKSETESTYQFNWLSKTLGTTFWFNPLWIARHMIILELANILTGKTGFISFLPQALYLGSVSFLMQLPVTLVVNYIIICHLTERTRFFWASVFSGTLSIYYAVMKVYF